MLSYVEVNNALPINKEEHQHIEHGKPKRWYDEEKKLAAQTGRQTRVFMSGMRYSVLVVCAWSLWGVGSPASTW